MHGAAAFERRENHRKRGAAKVRRRVGMSIRADHARDAVRHGGGAASTGRHRREVA